VRKILKLWLDFWPRLSPCVSQRDRIHSPDDVSCGDDRR